MAVVAMELPKPAFYFFDVGQGDSELLQLGAVQILIDGGPPNGRALEGLEKAMAPGDRHIDLAILTHPHLDHWGGLPDIMKRYSMGKFLTNGERGESAAYESLREPDMALGEGDSITWGDYRISILGPDAAERSDTDPNKGSVVMLLESPDARILYMGDAHAENEERLRKKYDVKADVLKAGHHGSRFSSDNAFLSEVKPEIAVIEVGKNSYGHPSPQALERLEEDAHAKIYATLDRGTIKLVPNGGVLRIYTKK